MIVGTLGRWYVQLVDLLKSHFVAGELDPERMGSGIQYGDASLRRLQRQQQTQKRPDCAC